MLHNICISAVAMSLRPVAHGHLVVGFHGNIKFKKKKKKKDFFLMTTPPKPLKQSTENSHRLIMRKWLNCIFSITSEVM